MQVGVFYLFAFICYLKKKKPKVNWSAALGVVRSTCSTLGTGEAGEPSLLVFIVISLTTLSPLPIQDVNILRLRDSLLMLETKVPVALISDANQKSMKRKNLNKGRRTWIKMLKKGSCALCIWWSVHCFAVVYPFVYVTHFVVVMFGLAPSVTWPSVTTFTNRRTPKHLGLLICTGPPSYFISWVPMLIPFTLCTVDLWS